MAQTWLQFFSGFLVDLGILLFSFSSALVEGWKWRNQAGKPDTAKFINDGNYHVWRTAMSLGVVLIALGIHFSVLEFGFLFSYLFSWIIYERTMSLVENDNIMAKRAPFRLLGKQYPRCTPAVEVMVCGMAFVLWVLLKFAGVAECLAVI